VETTKGAINYLNRVKILKFMKCSTCSRKAEVSLEHLGNLCRDCFLRVIEKRIRKNARINKLFRKNDRIIVFDSLSFYIVNKIVKDLPKKLFFYKKYGDINQLNDPSIVRYTQRNKISNVVVPWTLDDEINCFLERIFLNKKNKVSYTKLFKCITEEELEHFCKFNNLKYIKNKKNKDIIDFIDKTDKRYAGTKFKLLKSSRISELL